MDFPDLRQYPYFAYDTETTGLNYPIDFAFACSIATPDDKSWYYDFRHQPKAVEWLNDQLPLLVNKNIICHNASFDAGMSLGAGVFIPLHLLDDTAIRACLIDEHLATRFPWHQRAPGNYSLDYLCNKYLGLRKKTIDIDNIMDLPIEEAAIYAKQDAVLALKLWEWQEKEIEYKELRNIDGLERRVLPKIASSELKGIRVDLDATEQAMKAMTPIIDGRQRALDDMAGWNINTNSPPQIRRLFDPVEDEHGYWWVGDTQIGTTGKGAPSFKSEYLRELADPQGGNDPRAQLVVDIRSGLKTRDTFLAKHILEHEVRGRVYPTINQVAGDQGGTKTGRLSYVDPAMQQIPSRDKVTAAIVKPCFLPDEGDVWMDYDLNQFEVRIFVALAGMYNEKIIEIYAKDPRVDFHQYVADISGLPRDAEYPGQPYAKQLNLSMIFCQGRGATAAKMGMPVTEDSFVDAWGHTIRFFRAGVEADAIIDQYHARLPGVRLLGDTAKAIAEKRGFIKTKFGRHIHFPKGYRSYKASGLLIQTTSADINKENWILVDDALNGRGRIILNTHDSYSLSCSIDEYERAGRDVQGVVEREFLGIPLLLDFNGVGQNWWSALKNKGIEGACTNKRSKGN